MYLLTGKLITIIQQSFQISPNILSVIMANVIKVKSYPFSTHNPLRALPTTFIYKTARKIIFNINMHTFGCYNLLYIVHKPRRKIISEKNMCARAIHFSLKAKNFC